MGIVCYFLLGVGDNIHTLRETLLGMHDINSSFACGGRGTGQIGDRVERGTFHCIPPYFSMLLNQKMMVDP